MNLGQATLARSDQLNADDLVGGPQTFTVAEVRRGDNEQPVSIVLEEYPASRPFKPSKTVLRILSYIWGEETDNWPERPRFTLYRDASVKWAGQEIGGIRVSHMSHITERKKIALAESKGKKSLHVVEPLPDIAPEPKPEPLADSALWASTDVDQLRAWWKQHPAQRPDIEARMAEIKPDATTDPAPVAPVQP